MANESPVSASFNTSFEDINAGVFGGDTSSQTNASSTSEETKTGSSKTRNSSIEKTTVDESAILKMIDDIIKGTGGLADIFGAELSAGLSGGSVSKEGATGLLAAIAGEIAKVTSVTESSQLSASEESASGSSSTSSSSSTDADSSGIADNALSLATFGLF